MKKPETFKDIIKYHIEKDQLFSKDIDSTRYLTHFFYTMNKHNYIEHIDRDRDNSEEKLLKSFYFYVLAKRTNAAVKQPIVNEMQGIELFFNNDDNDYSRQKISELGDKKLTTRQVYDISDYMIKKYNEYDNTIIPHGFNAKLFLAMNFYGNSPFVGESATRYLINIGKIHLGAKLYGIVSRCIYELSEVKNSNTLQNERKVMEDMIMQDYKDELSPYSIEVRELLTETIKKQITKGQADSKRGNTTIINLEKKIKYMHGTIFNTIKEATNIRRESEKLFEVFKLNYCKNIDINLISFSEAYNLMSFNKFLFLNKPLGSEANIPEIKTIMSHLVNTNNVLVDSHGHQFSNPNSDKRVIENIAIKYLAPTLYSLRKKSKLKDSEIEKVLTKTIAHLGIDISNVWAKVNRMVSPGHKGPAKIDAIARALGHVPELRGHGKIADDFYMNINSLIRI